jgi:hypothetical protein
MKALTAALAEFIADIRPLTLLTHAN